MTIGRLQESTPRRVRPRGLGPLRSRSTQRGLAAARGAREWRTQTLKPPAIAGEIKRSAPRGYCVQSRSNHEKRRLCEAGMSGGAEAARGRRAAGGGRRALDLEEGVGHKQLDDDPRADHDAQVQHYARLPPRPLRFSHATRAMAHGRHIRMVVGGAGQRGRTTRTASSTTGPRVSAPSASAPPFSRATRSLFLHTSRAFRCPFNRGAWAREESTRRVGQGRSDPADLGALAGFWKRTRSLGAAAASSSSASSRAACLPPPRLNLRADAARQSSRLPPPAPPVRLFHLLSTPPRRLPHPVPRPEPCDPPPFYPPLAQRPSPWSTLPPRLAHLRTNGDSARALRHSTFQRPFSPPRKL